MNKGFAPWADPSQDTPGRRLREILRHVPGGLHGQPTFYAIDLSWCAVLLAALATILEEAQQDGTKNEGRPLTIDGWKSLLDPATNRIFAYV